MNGLDLSGLDLRKLKLQSARINDAKFVGSNLDGVMLDQAWALKSDFTNATFKGANLFSTQFRDAKLDNANFCGRADRRRFHARQLEGRQLQ